MIDMYLPSLITMQGDIQPNQRNTLEFELLAEQRGEQVKLDFNSIQAPSLSFRMRWGNADTLSDKF